MTDSLYEYRKLYGKTLALVNEFNKNTIQLNIFDQDSDTLFFTTNSTVTLVNGTPITFNNYFAGLIPSRVYYLGGLDVNTMSFSVYDSNGSIVSLQVGRSFPGTSIATYNMTPYYVDLKLVISEKVSQLWSLLSGSDQFLQDPSITDGPKTFIKSENIKLFKNFNTLMPQWSGLGYDSAHRSRSVFTNTNSGWYLTPSGPTNTPTSFINVNNGFSTITTGLGIGPDGTIYFGLGNGYFIAWSFKLGYPLWINYDQYYSGNGSLPFTGTPAIGSDGTIYVSTGGMGISMLYAISNTGNTLWTATGGGSPVIGADGTIYTSDSDYGGISAYNPDGSLKWRYILEQYFSSPALGYVDNGSYNGVVIYTGCSDYNVYALKDDGTVLWNYTTGDSIYSSPSIGSDGTVYIGSNDSSMYALNGATGELIGQYFTGGSVTCTPAIGDDGTVYITSQDNHIHAIEKFAPSAVVWKTTSETFTRPLAQDTSGNIYANVNSSLYIWGRSSAYITSLRFDYSLTTAPVINGGNLYAGTANGLLNYSTVNPASETYSYYTNVGVDTAPLVNGNSVYFGGRDNNLYCFDTKYNIMRWVVNTGTNLWNSPSIDVVESTVYAQNTNGDIYAIDDTYYRYNTTTFISNETIAGLFVTDASNVQALDTVYIPENLITGSGTHYTQVYVKPGYVSTSLSSISVNAGTITIIVGSTSGFTTTSSITISGTTHYNGVYTDITVIDSYTIQCVNPASSSGTETYGRVSSGIGIELTYTQGDNDNVTIPPSTLDSNLVVFTTYPSAVIEVYQTINNNLIVSNASGITALSPIFFPDGDLIRGGATYYVDSNYTNTFIESITYDGTGLITFTVISTAGFNTDMTVSGTVDYDGYYDSISIINGTTIEAQYMGSGSPRSESSGCTSPGYGIPLTVTPGGDTAHFTDGTYALKNSIIFIILTANNIILSSGVKDKITTILTNDITNSGLIFGCTDGNIYMLSTDGNDLSPVIPTGSPIRENLAIDSSKNIYYIADNGYLYSKSLITSNGGWISQQISSGSINSSPVLNSDGSVVYIGSSDGYLYGINTIDGTTNALYQDSISQNQNFSYPMVDPLNKHVYVGTDIGNLYSLNMNASTILRWNIDMNTSPVIVNETYEDSMAIGADGTIYVGFTENGTLNGYLIGLDKTTGNFLYFWEAPSVDAPQQDVTMFAPTVGSDGTLYACSNTQISALI